MRSPIGRIICERERVSLLWVFRAKARSFLLEEYIGDRSSTYEVKCKEDREREERKLDYIHHENELLSRTIYLHESSGRLSMDLSTEVLSRRF